MILKLNANKILVYMTDYWTRTLFIEPYRMKKTLNYLYYIAFILVFLVLIDTIFTGDQESFSILSILTNKTINIIIYSLVLLLYTNLIIKNRRNKRLNWWIAVFDKYRTKLNKWRWLSSFRFLRIWIPF